jgi:hypothetical protein
MAKLLFGDSTPFPYSVNVLDSAAGMVHCALRVCAAEGTIRSAAGRVEVLRRQLEQELHHLAVAQQSARTALTTLADSAAGKPAARAALKVVEAIDAEFAQAYQDVKAAAEESTASALTLWEAERRAVVEALGELVSSHTLAGAAHEIILEFAERGYRGKMVLKTEFGLQAQLELSVPAGHLFARPVLVGELVRDLKVSLPMGGGWLGGRGKLRRVRLDKMVVQAVTDAPGKTLIRLDEFGGDHIVNISFDDDASTPIAIVVVDRNRGDAVGPAVAPDQDAVAQLERMRALVQQSAQQLQTGQRSLTRALLEGVAVEDLDNPLELGRRMIEWLAPLVNEIARRSPSENELSLKWDRGDGRREELFIDRVGLLDIIERLPHPLKEQFAAFRAPATEKRPAVINLAELSHASSLRVA